MKRYNQLSNNPSIKTKFSSPNDEIQPQTDTEPQPYFTANFMFFIFEVSLGFLHTICCPLGLKILNLRSLLDITQFQNSKDLDLQRSV